MLFVAFMIICLDAVHANVLFSMTSLRNAVIFKAEWVKVCKKRFLMVHLKCTIKLLFFLL